MKHTTTYQNRLVTISFDQDFYPMSVIDENGIDLYAIKANQQAIDDWIAEDVCTSELIKEVEDWWEVENQRLQEIEDRNGRSEAEWLEMLNSHDGYF